jgi:hypothetical protein
MIKTFPFALVVAVAVLCSIGISCKKDNPVQPTPPGHTAISLQATFSSIRWCRLQWTNDSTAASHHYILIRDNRDTIFSDTVEPHDALRVLRDTALKPGTGYTYWIYRIVEGMRWDSATVNVRTLDTSRDYLSWETIRLGVAGNVLYGVWGMSPSSVWLAGDIWNADSDRHCLAVHWVNGHFEYPHVDLGGTLNAVGGLSDSLVWFAGDNVLSMWNGSQFISHVFDGDSLPFWNTKFTSLWIAPDGMELFATGTNGIILHRKSDGKTWQKMESGVSGYSFSRILTFASNDIYVVGETADPNEGILIHYDGSVWATVVKGVATPSNAGELQGRFTDVTGSSTDSIVLVGEHVYHKVGSGWETRTPTNLGDLSLTEGADAHTWNNVFLVGDFGQVIKFDGEKWVQFPQLLNAGPNEILRAVRVIGEDVFIVGDDDRGAILIHGH